MGQNEGYINRIESGKTLPSMNAFLFICDYLKVSPSEFFEMENTNPVKVKKLDEKLKKLNDKQLDLIYQIVCEFEN
ncbi:MAG: helix-turn-helix transcriptional regulator [Clostridia bacterium]